ncbi:aminoglycoside phosphotransferase family protein [Bacillus sp. C1-1]|nr:aminoglycoside phosphotransferase family protein [Bacillus sp. C1-1]
MAESIWIERISQFDSTLRIHKLEMIHSGWDHTILFVNDTLVFRFPKKRGFEMALHKELELNRALQARQTSLSVPRLTPLFIEETLVGLSYPLIAGVPVKTIEDQTTLSTIDCQHLGNFLTTLHRITVDELPNLHATHSHSFWDTMYAQLRQNIFPQLETNVSHAINIVYEDFLESLSSNNRKPVPIHGDLTTANMIYSQGEQKLVGIIDFTDAQLSDPAYDFAGLYWTYGLDTVLSVLRYYKTDECKQGIVERVKRFYGLQPLFHHLLYLHEQKELDKASPLVNRFLELKKLGGFR